MWRIRWVTNIVRSFWQNKFVQNNIHQNHLILLIPKLANIQFKFWDVWCNRHLNENYELSRMNQPQEFWFYIEYKNMIFLRFFLLLKSNIWFVFHSWAGCFHDVCKIRKYVLPPALIFFSVFYVSDDDCALKCMNYHLTSRCKNWRWPLSKGVVDNPYTSLDVTGFCISNLSLFFGGSLRYLRFEFDDKIVLGWNLTLY